MSDDRDRDVENARLLADRARAGDLTRCSECGKLPTFKVDPESKLDRPMILHDHEPWCPWHDDHALTVEFEVEPVRVALDWIARQERKRRDDE